MLPLVNEPYLTLKPYVPGKPVSETERELGISGCVKLASNENPLGPSPKAVEAVQAALATLHDYPDGGAFYFKNRLAEFLGVNSDQLIVGNGTNEIIEMIFRTVLRPGENTIYSQASFIVYKLIPMAMGAEIREVPTLNMGYDLEAISDAVDDNTKLIFLANPNNPTGTYVSKADLDRFIDKLPEHVLLVIDEAYFEYADADDYPSGIEYLDKRERVMVTRTFSKCYGLAGLRIGFGIANAKLIDFLNRGRQPFNVNSLAQIGAMAALDDTDHVAQTVALNRSEMDRVVPELEALGLGITPSQANFVLADFHRDGAELFETLLRKGVIVRPMAGYGLASSARITIGTKEQNDKLVAVLKEVLGS